MEDQGFPMKRESNGQYEFACPFHEEPGPVPPRKSPNFYINKTSSKYYCQAATCSEKGNLITLERHFGIDSDDPTFKSRETELQEYEAQLNPLRRQVFYDAGLTDETIERFRLGYDGANDRYVIPYLEGKRAKYFRFYDPLFDTRPERESGAANLKYYWEKGASSELFNVNDAVGDKDGIVFICEGEKKAMLVAQMGFAAVAVPGAGQWKSEWSQLFNQARQIIVLYDNDNPEAQKYDQHRKKCPVGCEEIHVCKKCGPDGCKGHNPGQENALKVAENFSWRAKNVVLPRVEGTAKTDINDYFVRDGGSLAEFKSLALGIKKDAYVVQSFAQIAASPPPEATFLVAEGILPKGGRLLVSGAPKVGKSIYVQNLVLSLASGIPFLRKFAIDHPTRVLLLDRELSRRALYDRLSALMGDRPGYQAAAENLLIDHDHNIRIDQQHADETLIQLIEQNGVEVLVLDTAYKFFSGDMESTTSVNKALGTLDKVIAQTGVSVVLTHHHRKSSGGGKGKEDGPHPDQVVGSFLWTGWPNGTVLLNFAKDRVKEPFTTVCSFTAFRDAAPPEPLLLHRTRESISYTAISTYVPPEESQDGRTSVGVKLSLEAVGSLLLEMQPCLENDFLHAASGYFRCQSNTVKTLLIDLLDSSDDFVRTGTGGPNSPFVLRLNEVAEESWEAEHQGQQVAVNQLMLVEN